MNALRTPTTILALLALAACSAGQQPLDHDTVRRTATGSLHDHVEGVSRAVELAVRAPFWGDLERSIGIGPGDCGTCEAPVVVDPTEAGELADEIVDRLFPADTVESSSETEVVYRLSAAHVCDGDETCADLLALAAVRLVVSAPAEGAIDIAVLAGESRLHPFTLHLARDQISADVDLGQLRDVIALYSSVLDIDPGALPTLASGEITVALVRNAANDFTASLAINRRVDFGSTFDEGSYRIIVDAAPAAASLRIDGNTHQVHAELGFGRIQADAAFAFFAPLMEECDFDEVTMAWTCTQPSLRGTLGLEIPGATGRGVLDAQNRSADIEGFALGGAPSRLTFDGQDLITVDLRDLASAGLAVALRGADDALDVAVDPSLEIRTEVFFRRIADQVADLPAWTMEDHSSMSLAGAASPAIRIPYDSGEVAAAVTAGTMTFSGDALVSPVVVSTGQCLWVHDIDRTHPFTALTSGACP